MRDKEEITDYRFIPEPNLPFLKIRPEWVTECAASVSSEPSYVKYQQLGFNPRRAVHYAENPTLSRFVDFCADRVKNIGTEEFIAWMKELKMMMQRSKAVYPPEDPEFANQFMTVVEFYVGGRITKQRALATLRGFLSNLQDAEQLFNEKNLWRITDETLIDEMVEAILTKNEKLLEKALAGHAKSLTRLRGLVVDSSEKRIDADEAERAVLAKLTKLKGPTVVKKSAGP
ncbi:GatB/Yqey domain protein [Cooperia oncophora]